MTDLINQLMKPEPYPHPVGVIQLIETHISWVIMTGEYAYKIKKPVILPFLDFSTLALRKHYCDEELRLNQRFAPDLYLDVVGIYGSVARPSLHDGSKDRDQPFEYAVRMRQFAAGQRLDELINSGKFTERDIDVLAHSIALLHQSSVIYFDEQHGGDPDDHSGEPEHIIEPALDNFKELLDHPPPGAAMHKEAHVERWTRGQSILLGDVFRQRRSEGKIRECHGDLHLANLYQHGAKIQPFDCIEFNPDWRSIDVINEIGFLFMDMLAQGYEHYAWRFLNAYLERTGDYGGLRLLRYYTVYRAMVRAKTTALRLQVDFPKPDGGTLLQQYQAYIDLAYRFTRTPLPLLAIMCGLSGSGKSTVAGQLMAELPAIRLRSDSERKRLQDLSTATDSSAAVNCGIYKPAVTAETYQHLQCTAADILAAGYSVIIDAACLQRAQRDKFRQLAKRMSIPFTILYCHANTAILEQRVIRRQQLAEGVSDAGAAVLLYQLQGSELPCVDDESDVISICTDSADSPAALAAQALTEIQSLR